MVNVSVIIVNYNTYTLVKDCIKSIYKFSENISFEIIVVDNASPDRSIDQIVKDYPEVIYIKSPKNGGFGYANNLGATHACGEYLFLLNSDTVLISNATKILYDYSKSNKNVGICGGNLFTPELQPDFSFYQMYPSPKTEFDHLIMNIFSKKKYGKNICFNYSQKSFKIDGYISGADLFISAKVFSEIGGFNEKFFMYYEDTDLNYRVKKMGLEIHSVPNARIIHINGGSQEKENILQNKWMRDSHILFYRKNNIKGFRLSIYIKVVSLLKSFCGNIIIMRFKKAKVNLNTIQRILSS